eukprot:51878-Hanusia_phi.AAC.1
MFVCLPGGPGAAAADSPGPISLAVIGASITGWEPGRRGTVPGRTGPSTATVRLRLMIIVLRSADRAV